MSQRFYSHQNFVFISYLFFMRATRLTSVWPIYMHNFRYYRLPITLNFSELGQEFRMVAVVVVTRKCFPRIFYVCLCVTRVQTSRA